MTGNNMAAIINATKSEACIYYQFGCGSFEVLYTVYATARPYL